MTFHVVGPRSSDFHIRFPEALVCSFSLVPAEILDSNISLWFVTMSILVAHSLWVQPIHTWSKNEVGSSKSTSFIRIFQVGFMFSVLPAILISSTNTDKNSPLARLTNKYSSFKTFSQPLSKIFFQIAFPTIALPEGDPANPFREGLMDLHHWTMIWAICASVDASKYLDILTLEFSITLTNPPFWPAKKRILHQLLDLNILEVWNSCPWLLRLSSVMLMILVQWVLRTHQNPLL